MNTRTRLGIAVPVVLLAMVLGFGIAQALQKGQEYAPATTSSLPALANWVGYYVHRVYEPEAEALDVGGFNSVAFSPLDGYPYISYYDATKGDLMLASPVPQGGSNCGVNGNWWCRAVDETGNVGQHSSIDLWSDANGDWLLGISYYDATNYALKFAEWSCFDGYCDWIIDTISVGNLLNPRGLYTSLKYGSNGKPYIAYYSSSIMTGESLQYAYYKGSGGNCGTGDALNAWECTKVDSGNHVGMYASLDLDNENRVYMAYYDEGSGDLKYATYVGIGGNCGPGLDWNCDIVDGVGKNTGMYPSIKAPRASGETARIAYYDKTNEMLRYATLGQGGNCGVGWICIDVDHMGSNLSQMGVAMDLDQEGQPIIAYQQVPDEEFAHSILKMARPYFAYDDGNFGNCGEPPPGYLFNYWRCNAMDNAGAHTYEADYVSLAVNSSGLVEIAYSEWDDYYEVTSLKVLYQRQQIYIPTLRK